MTYLEKLKDPRWQKKRLEILNRDEFKCCLCSDTKTTLHVHHKEYKKGRDPWDYPDYILQTLCANCHLFIETLKKQSDCWAYEYITKIIYKNSDINPDKVIAILEDDSIIFSKHRNKYISTIISSEDLKIINSKISG